MSSSAENIDPLVLQEILGYLNYSSGASDPAFLRRLNELWKAIAGAGVPAEQSLATARQLLAQRLDELAASNSTFRDAEQARALLRLVFDDMPAAYREHHRELLFHQSDADLWQPFFIGRVAEAALAAGPPWDETQRIVRAALERLNDFLGHRPVPVLESHKHELYAHERVRPVPLFIAGAGVSVGKYREIVEGALSILKATDRNLLDAAWFDPEALDELALDPRAYDFNHPANRRPNYHFGQWDPHLIDNKGRYRRFVIQQCTLDAVLARIDGTPDVPREQLLFEGAAVLAGTILMASGTSGSGPETHDSTVSLATLLPHIARYRDAFYDSLFAKVPGEHRLRLEQEAAARRQPFAGARQHLNAELSRLRALQMQHVQLARVFARLGFPDAAMRQADVVPAASARMMCQMQCRLTAAHRAADAGNLSEAFAALPEVESLLRRGIECGAIVDPWNILGFGGQFSLFAALENSIPDPRVEELLDLIEQIFALYSRLWHEAAIADNAELRTRLPPLFRKLAEWWDQFATRAVSGIQHISGNEAYAAAHRVAEALAAWHKAGDAAGKVAFWAPHAETFDSPQAYARVIEVLLDKPDLPAAMALLMHWLSQADEVRLEFGPRSFFGLALRWLRTALRRATSSDATESDRTFVLKFFDHLEANAEAYWDVPDWQGDTVAASGNAAGGEDSAAGRSNDTAAGKSGNGGDDRNAGNEDDDDDDLFGAAYENMVYRDSTADDIDADMLEGPGAGNLGDDEMEEQQQRLSGRLAFLSMLAALWKMTALATAGAQHAGVQPFAAGPTWLTRAADNQRRLLALAGAVQRHPVRASSANYDALLDYDRRRLTHESLLEKVIGTLTGAMEAEVLLAAAANRATAGTAASGLALVAVWSAVLKGDANAVQQHWAALLTELTSQPLLYVPLARGGDAGKIAAARAAQQAIRELLRRLPRLGLLRETCQLLRVARAMEKEHSPGPGSVTEFDRLFEVGYKAIVESLVEAASDPPPASPTTKSRKAKSPAAGKRRRAPRSESAADAQLIDCLQQVTESLLSEWLSHSRTLRLSVLERVTAPGAWDELVAFIRRYGNDLFTQQFFHLGNLRAILHQGVDHWLDRLAEDDDASEQLLLVQELNDTVSRADAKKHLGLVIEAIVENYTEYRDYNATTTQSDRGEMLFTLLDFLRLKAGYERTHWNLRPVMMAHDVLVRRGCSGAAELWRRAMAERTSDVADQYVKRLSKLQTQYAIRLPTIADRLAERFVRPLAIDRVRSLMAPAVEEARRGEPPTTFSLLEQEASELAQEPCGAGLDLPDWLEALDDEADRVTAGRGTDDRTAEPDAPPAKRLTWDEIQSQLSDWENPPDAAE